MTTSHLSNNTSSLVETKEHNMNNNNETSTVSPLQSNELFHDIVPQSRTTTQTIPIFDIKWFQRGRRLGKGSFCAVDEIKLISLPKCSTDDNDTVDDTIRHVIANQSHPESGRPTYAIKSLREEIKEDPAGLDDLARESKILSMLEHPHIIKLYGITSSCSGQLSVDDFLILDCLHDTLENRLNTWYAVNRKSICEKIMDRTCCGTNNNIPMNCLQDRLCDAYKVSGALEYIHNKKIIHRDLKPANMGYDQENNIRIFDFGFAKQLTEVKMNIDGTYDLKCAGTYRYMAPEVALEKPYNMGCDVYSFAIILWEMITLMRPFPSSITPVDFLERQFPNDERPPLCGLCGLQWSQHIQELLSNSWETDLSSRLAIGDVRAQLYNIYELCQEE